MTFFASSHALLVQKNYKDVALREVAREKVQSARAKADAQQPKYRDRASERRVMHNQPDVPRPAPADKPVTKRKSEGPPPPEPTPAPPPNPGQDDTNIGNKLLKMMGWKEGQGLGTEGDGRVDPMYVYSSSRLPNYFTNNPLMSVKLPSTLLAQGWAQPNRKTSASSPVTTPDMSIWQRTL